MRRGLRHTLRMRLRHAARSQCQPQSKRQSGEMSGGWAGDHGHAFSLMEQMGEGGNTRTVIQRGWLMRAY